MILDHHKVVILLNYLTMILDCRKMLRTAFYMDYRKTLHHMSSVSSISAQPPNSMEYEQPQSIEQYGMTHNTPVGTNVLYGPLQQSAPLLSGLPQNSIYYGPPQNAARYGYKTQSSTPYGPPQSSRLPQADASCKLEDTVRFTVWLHIN